MSSSFIQVKSRHGSSNRALFGSTRFDSIRSSRTGDFCSINRVEQDLCSVRKISVRVRFDSTESSPSRTEVLFGSMFVRFDSIGLDRMSRLTGTGHPFLELSCHGVFSKCGPDKQNITWWLIELAVLWPTFIMRHNLLMDVGNLFKMNRVQSSRVEQRPGSTRLDSIHLKEITYIHQKVMSHDECRPEHSKLNQPSCNILFVRATLWENTMTWQLQEGMAGSGPAWHSIESYRVKSNEHRTEQHLCSTRTRFSGVRTEREQKSFEPKTKVLFDSIYQTEISRSTQSNRVPASRTEVLHGSMFVRFDSIGLDGMGRSTGTGHPFLELSCHGVFSKCGPDKQNITWWLIELAVLWPTLVMRHNLLMDVGNLFKMNRVQSSRAEASVRLELGLDSIHLWRSTSFKRLCRMMNVGQSRQAQSTIACNILFVRATLWENTR